MSKRKRTGKQRALRATLTLPGLRDEIQNAAGG